MGIRRVTGARTVGRGTRTGDDHLVVRIARMKRVTLIALHRAVVERQFIAVAERAAAE